MMDWGLVVGTGDVLQPDLDKIAIRGLIRTRVTTRCSANAHFATVTLYGWPGPQPGEAARGAAKARHGKQKVTCQSLH